MKLVGQVVRFVLVAGVILAAVFFGGRMVVALVGANPVMLSFDADAERGGCPGTPNCVSTHARTPEHAIDPITCEADTATAVAAFDDAISTLPDVERLDERSWVVYSRVFRFPDDVRIDVTNRGIEVFSASRLGSGDLGVNRRRVEHLRELLAEDERCL